jgi:hypothetical protein
MSEEIIGGRIEKADLFLPFTPDLDKAYDPQPIYRIVLDISYGRSMGYLQKGYYLKLNDSIYYIVKQKVEVMTNRQTEKVLEFFKRSQMPFTIIVNSDKTLSGHQNVELYDITSDTMLCTVRDYEVNRGLWQEIEGKLFQNTYSPSIARFIDGRLVWYVKLMPEHSLHFEQVASITLNYIASQGHLEIYRIIKDENFIFPSYLYITPKNFRFYNHYINGVIDVIPLGSERRIISVGQEKDITSDDHDTIHVDAGQYLLFHPLPRRDGAD